MTVPVNIQHDAEAAAQIFLFDLIDVDAVVPDLAVCDVIEPVDEVGDGHLACADGSDLPAVLIIGRCRKIPRSKPSCNASRDRSPDLLGT